MVDTRGGPYKFDFLETIVGINFAPPAGYIIVEVEAHKAVNDGPAGPCPDIRLELGSKQVLIDSSETCQKVTTPASSGFSNPIYFIWNALAAFPTVENMFELIDESNDISYAQQFARIVNMGMGYQLLHSYGEQFLTGLGNGGFWDNLADATLFATKWNNRFVPGTGSGPYPEMAFSMTGVPPNTAITQVGPGSTLVSVRSLSRPFNFPESGMSTARNRYLVKVPRAYTELTIVTDADDTPNVTVKGYHGKTPPRIINVNPDGYDTVDNGQDSTVSSQVTKDGPQGADFTIVSVEGGTGGGEPS